MKELLVVFKRQFLTSFSSLKKCCNHPYIFPGQEKHHQAEETVFSSMIASSGKLQLLEKLLPKLKQRGNRVLLFSQMTAMLDILEDFVFYLGLKFFRIDGQTGNSSRHQQMKEFNAPGSDIFIFLISTRAGALGINLHTADRVIIYDPDFNPFMDLQAQSRAHRIGQVRPVVVYQLITNGTVEEKILQKSKKKLAIENLVMNYSKNKAKIGDEKYLHSVILHGAKKIMNSKNIQAMKICYDDAAIETLFKLDPKDDEIYILLRIMGILIASRALKTLVILMKKHHHLLLKQMIGRKFLGPLKMKQEILAGGKDRRMMLSMLVMMMMILVMMILAMMRFIPHIPLLAVIAAILVVIWI